MTVLLAGNDLFEVHPDVAPPSQLSPWLPLIRPDKQALSLMRHVPQGLGMAWLGGHVWRPQVHVVVGG
jgi:hypothetical protein